jgi:hypothetical protein
MSHASLDEVPMAIQLSRAHLPQTSQDLDTLHKDPMFELINGAKEAYYMKYLAAKLGNKIAKSEDVKDLSRLIEDSSREIERNWRMAACMANAPRSTGYPYLPTMPLASNKEGVGQGQPQAAAGPSGESVASAESTKTTVTEDQAGDQKNTPTKVSTLTQWTVPVWVTERRRPHLIKSFIYINMYGFVQ